MALWSRWRRVILLQHPGRNTLFAEVVILYWFDIFVGCIFRLLWWYFGFIVVIRLWYSCVDCGLCTCFAGRPLWCFVAKGIIVPCCVGDSRPCAYSAVARSWLLRLGLTAILSAAIASVPIKYILKRRNAANFAISSGRKYCLTRWLTIILKIRAISRHFHIGLASDNAFISGKYFREINISTAARLVTRQSNYIIFCSAR